MPPVAQFRWTARGHPACQLGKPFSRSGASLPPHTLRAEWQRWILLEDSSCSSPVSLACAAAG